MIDMDEVYHVTDLPAEKLPHGTATVFWATQEDQLVRKKALIGDNGFLRTRNGQYVPKTLAVEPL